MRHVKFITLILVLFFSANAKSQVDTSVGWYQILPEAQVKVILGNSSDNSNKIDISSITYSVNEVLLVFAFSKDVYYCYDPDGRMVLIKGKASLKRITLVGRPVTIISEVSIGLETKLKVGNNVWLIGFNSANKTATILLADGTKADVPQDSIIDLKAIFESMVKSTEWNSVE